MTRTKTKTKRKAPKPDSLVSKEAGQTLASLLDTPPVGHEVLVGPFDLAEVFGIRPQRTPNPKKVRLSRIRVQLNRPLTHAHVEDITHRGVQFRLTVSPNRMHLWADGAMASRQMYRIVEKVLAENYVNYLPRAVRTFSEYSGHGSQ